MDWGTLVCTKGTAPCSLSTCTSTQSDSDGIPSFKLKPSVESWPLGKEDTNNATGPFSSPGTHPPPPHWPDRSPKDSGPEMSFKAPRAGCRQTQRQCGRLRPNRVYLVAEAFLEAHGDTIEQALPWGLGQLSLTVSQIGGHTVGPFVHFPGLGKGKWTQGSQLPLFFKFLLLHFL